MSEKYLGNYLKVFAKLLKDLEVSEVVLRVGKDGNFQTRVINVSHTVMVEAEGWLDIEVPAEGFLYFKPDEMWRALRAVEQPIGVFKSGDGYYVIEVAGTEVGEFHLTEGSFKSKHPYWWEIWPEPLSLDIMATIKVPDGRWLRSLANAAKEAGSDEILFGVKKWVPYVGFSFFEKGRTTAEIGRWAEVSVYVKDTATDASTDYVFKSLPHEWVGKGLTVELDLPDYLRPLRIRYTYGTVSVRIWIAPLTTIEEEDLKKLLEEAPTLLKPLEGVSGYWDIDYEFFDTIRQLMEDGDTFAVFEGESMAIYGRLRGYQDIRYFAIPIEFVERHGSASGTYIIGTLKKYLDFYKLFTDYARIQVVGEDVYLWDMNVGTAFDSVVADEVKKIRGLITLIEDRYAFKGDTTVRELQVFVKNAEEFYRRETERRALGPNDLYLVVNWNGEVYAYLPAYEKAERVGKLYGSYGVTQRYGDVDCYYLKHFLSGLKSRDYIRVFLGEVEHEGEFQPMLFTCSPHLSVIQFVVGSIPVEDPSLVGIETEAAASYLEQYLKRSGKAILEGKAGFDERVREVESSVKEIAEDMAKGADPDAVEGKVRHLGYLVDSLTDWVKRHKEAHGKWAGALERLRKINPARAEGLSDLAKQIVDLNSYIDSTMLKVTEEYNKTVNTFRTYKTTRKPPAPPTPPPEVEKYVEEVKRRFTDAFDRYKAARERYELTYSPRIKPVVEHLRKGDLPPKQMLPEADAALDVVKEASEDLGNAVKALRDFLSYVDSLPEDVRKVKEVEEDRKAVLSYIEELGRYADEVERLRKRIEELKPVYVTRYEVWLVDRMVSELEKAGVPRDEADKLVGNFKDEILRECEAVKNYGEQEMAVSRWVDRLKKEYEARKAPPPKPTLPPEVKAYVDSEVRKVARVYRVDWYDTRARVSVHKDSVEELRRVVERVGGKVTAEIPARPPLVILEADFSGVKPPAPPAPPAKPPEVPPRRPPAELEKEVVWDMFISEVRRIASERGVRVDEGDARRYFEERWPEVREVPRERVATVVKSLAADYVASVATRPPAVVPPPAVPAVPPIVISFESLTPEERGYYMTFGVERFVSEFGSKYRLTRYDIPTLASYVATYVRSAGERALREARNFRDWQAGYWLSQEASDIASDGIYETMKRFWSLAVAQAREFFSRSGLRPPEFATFYVLTKEGPQEFGGGRIWVEAIAYRMYELLGAEPPQDLAVAWRLASRWISEGCPPTLTVRVEEVGGLP